MDRISRTFENASEEGRACFVSYVCAGDPDFETSVHICRVLADGPVDIIELGVPFSDPLADGLTNQLAAQRALTSGMTPKRVFQLVSEVRTFSDKPIVLYTYYNLVFAAGVENYVGHAVDSGVDGLLVLDLPPEEAGELLEASRKFEMRNVFIVAPTTPPSRIRRIAQSASGFVYYVSLEGVTGVRERLAENIDRAVRQIRRATELPVVVGFGISTAEHVRLIGGIADGVVVGSALVNCVADYAEDPRGVIEQLGKKLNDLTSEL